MLAASLELRVDTVGELTQRHGEVAKQDSEVDPVVEYPLEAGNSSRPDENTLVLPKWARLQRSLTSVDATTSPISQ